jgi:hypothetical protein
VQPRRPHLELGATVKCYYVKVGSRWLQHTQPITTQTHRAHAHAFPSDIDAKQAGAAVYTQFKRYRERGGKGRQPTIRIVQKSCR